MADSRLEILTDSTPETGATKKTQLLVRRKLNSQWESFTDPIPTGEPCFSYDPESGECILKIGSVDSEGNLLTWS